MSEELPLRVLLEAMQHELVAQRAVLIHVIGRLSLDGLTTLEDTAETLKTAGLPSPVQERVDDIMKELVKPIGQLKGPPPPAR
jgi:hypothetical protein